MKETVFKYSLYLFCILYGWVSLLLQYGEISTLIQYHTFGECAKYALIPSLTVGGISGWIYGQFILNKVLSLKPLFLAVLLSVFLLLMAEPYLAAINRNFGKQEKVTMEGTIIRKYVSWISHEHAKRKILEIRVNPWKQNVKFEVNMSMFLSSAVGNEFKRNFMRGCLGWYY